VLEVYFYYYPSGPEDTLYVKNKNEQLLDLQNRLMPTSINYFTNGQQSTVNSQLFIRAQVKHLK